MYASKLIDAGRKFVPEIVFEVYLPLRTPKVAPEEPTDRQAIRTRVYIPVESSYCQVLELPYSYIYIYIYSKI